MLCFCVAILYILKHRFWILKRLVVTSCSWVINKYLYVSNCVHSSPSLLINFVLLLERLYIIRFSNISLVSPLFSFRWSVCSVLPFSMTLLIRCTWVWISWWCHKLYPIPRKCKLRGVKKIERVKSGNRLMLKIYIFNIRWLIYSSLNTVTNR